LHLCDDLAQGHNSGARTNEYYLPDMKPLSHQLIWSTGSRYMLPSSRPVFPVCFFNLLTPGPHPLSQTASRCFENCAHPIPGEALRLLNKKYHFSLTLFQRTCCNQSAQVPSSLNIPEYSSILRNRRAELIRCSAFQRKPYIFGASVSGALHFA